MPMLIAMTIPDDPAELAGWLERRVLGLDLAALVAELAAVHGDEPVAAGALEELLGPQRDAVLQSGLSVLPPAALRQLLSHPRLLPQLQELVLVEGGDHWRAVEQRSDLQAAMTRVWERIDGALATPDTIHPGKGKKKPADRRHFFLALATAAAVLIIVGVYVVTRPGSRPPAEPVVAWGWSKPGALPADAPPAVYLDGLAKGAHDWFNKRPDDAAGLAQRIKEMRQGCARLLEAEHRPLSDEDRQWLLGRCRAWAQKFDEQLAALEAGGDPATVRAAVDAVVVKLEDALDQRAKLRRA